MCFKYCRSQTAEVFASTLTQQISPAKWALWGHPVQEQIFILFWFSSCMRWVVARGWPSAWPKPELWTGCLAELVLLWVERFSMRWWRKKKCTFMFVISYLNMYKGTVRGALWRAGGTRTQSPVVWMRVQISSYFMRRAYASALQLKRSLHNHVVAVVEAEI